jgi:uncharacterized integral membrane protein
VAVLDPPTEPITELPAAAPAPPREPQVEPSAAPRATSPFDRTRFQFMSGIPAGETAYIRGEDGSAVLSYRSFASVVGIIAALMSVVVLVAGFGAVGFLIFERRPLPAIVAGMLSLAFSALIVMLVPPTRVSIFDSASPAVTITQQSSVSFPSVTYLITAPDGTPIGRITKSFFSRFGRNRWHFAGGDGRPRGFAVEESLSRAFLRKFLGKFEASFQSNIRIVCDDRDAGWIIRRPGADRHGDLLDLDAASAIDRRVAVALATLVLGSEP